MSKVWPAMEFLWFANKTLRQTSGQNSGQTFVFSWKSRQTQIQLMFDWGLLESPEVRTYEQPAVEDK
jgi:hypothetical protein